MAYMQNTYMREFRRNNVLYILIHMVHDNWLILKSYLL